MSLDDKDHAFEIIITSTTYNAPLAACYLEKHKVQEITMEHLNFPYCSQKCFDHVAHHLKYIIIYINTVALRPNAIPIDVVFLDYYNIM
jgi:hypothetical protein